MRTKLRTRSTKESLAGAGGFVAFAAAAGVGSVRLFTLMKPSSSAAVARTGYEAMKRGRRVVVHGLINKLLTQSLRVTPRRVVTLIVRKLQENRGG